MEGLGRLWVLTTAFGQVHGYRKPEHLGYSISNWIRMLMNGYM